MKAEYDFSNGNRGAVLPSSANKTRITIRIDSEIIEWFRAQVEKSGGGNYQTLINSALRQVVEGQQEPLEKVLRKVVREELKAVK